MGARSRTGPKLQVSSGPKLMGPELGHLRSPLAKKTSTQVVTSGGGFRKETGSGCKEAPD